MRINVVLAGTVLAGKTTLLAALRRALDGRPDCAFIEEAPAQFIAEKKACGENPYSNLVEFERTVMARQIAEENAVPAGTCLVFHDRSAIDHWAFTRQFRIGAEGTGLETELKTQVLGRKYDIVFMFTRTPFVSTETRVENEEEVIKQEAFLRSAYAEMQKALGFELHDLPLISVGEEGIAERVKLILRTVAELEDRLKKERATSALIKGGCFSPPSPCSTASSCTASTEHPEPSPSIFL